MSDLERSVEVALTSHNVYRLAIFETGSEDNTRLTVRHIYLGSGLNLQGIVKVDKDRASKSLRPQISEHYKLIAHHIDLNYLAVHATGKPRRHSILSL